MDKLTLPNALSALRLVLAIPSVIAVRQELWGLAGVILLLAVTTDLLDGWFARRLGQVSAFGGLLDHMSDAIFIAATLAALASHGMVPIALPALVVIAFSQYVLDSKALMGRQLRTSALGRTNGIAYFVLAAFPIFQQGLDVHPVPASWILIAGWALAASTLVSVIDRLIALARRRSAL